MHEAVSQAKAYYNTLLKRQYKALKYLDNQNISIDERLKWVHEHQDIMNSMGEMLDIIGKGNYTDDNILNGFEV